MFFSRGIRSTSEGLTMAVTGREEPLSHTFLLPRVKVWLLRTVSNKLHCQALHVRLPLTAASTSITSAAVNFSLLDNVSIKLFRQSGLLVQYSVHFRSPLSGKKHARTHARSPTPSSVGHQQSTCCPSRSEIQSKRTIFPVPDGIPTARTVLISDANTNSPSSKCFACRVSDLLCTLRREQKESKPAHDLILAGRITHYVHLYVDTYACVRTYICARTNSYVRKSLQDGSPTINISLLSVCKSLKSTPESMLCTVHLSWIDLQRIRSVSVEGLHTLLLVDKKEGDSP